MVGKNETIKILELKYFCLEHEESKLIWDAWMTNFKSRIESVRLIQN
jgi:hypothetical protein